MRVLVIAFFLCFSSISFASDNFYCVAQSIVQFEVAGSLSGEKNLQAFIEDVFYSIEAEKVETLKSDSNKFQLYVQYNEEEFIDIVYDRREEVGRVNLDFRGIRFSNQAIHCE